MIIKCQEGRKEMFYLTTHSTHFILWLYDIRHMVKNHSDSERGNPLPPHRLSFPISSNGSFICIIPQTGFVTPVMEHWLKMSESLVILNGYIIILTEHMNFFLQHNRKWNSKRMVICKTRYFPLLLMVQTSLS